MKGYAITFIVINTLLWAGELLLDVDNLTHNAPHVHTADEIAFAAKVSLFMVMLGVMFITHLIRSEWDKL